LTLTALMLPAPAIPVFIKTLLPVVLCQLCVLQVMGQYRHMADSIFKVTTQQLKEKKAAVRLPKVYNPQKDSLLKKRLIALPAFKFPAFSKPIIAFAGGRVDYTYYYRSNIDTPFIQQNVYQQQVNATAGLTVGNVLPLRVNTQIRRSNSLLFRNITDVQAEFDMAAFQQKMYSGITHGLRQSAELLKDSVTGMLSSLKSLELVNANNWFGNNFSLQQFIEANEMLQVPQLRYDKTLPDSLAAKKSDSIKTAAAAYIQLYNQAKQKVEKIQAVADSLKAVYEKSLMAVNQVKALAQGKITSLAQYRQLANSATLKEKGIQLLPKKYHWLLGIRKLSLGRSPVNYSELTAKNMSLNGINLEYNSRYYAAFSAGLVDYRFRDFVLNNPAKPRQYFYMGRLGIGRLEKNYFIISVFRGRKQVFASGVVNKLYAVNTTGISAEAKWQFNTNSYLKAEIAQSVAPDFSSLPVKNNKFGLAGKNDKALAASAHIAVPKLHTKLDAFYQYTGANFQSFSSFRNNSSAESWGIKAEQTFFKKVLRVTASVKANEFTNPYILQQYRSNTVFKSVQAVFRKKHWPVVSAGYMPLSQLTNVDGIVYENRFNSLNTTLYHHYRVGDMKAATTMVFTKFYNNAADTGFIYFNAANVFINQLMHFSRFTASVNITHSTNKNYELNVLDESIQVPVKRIGSILGGVKINHLNRQRSMVGLYGNIQFSFLRNTVISIVYDDGFIPGINGKLVKNTIGSVQVSKIF
jgi:hypothetical protein